MFRALITSLESGRQPDMENGDSIYIITENREFYIREQRNARNERVFPYK